MRTQLTFQIADAEVHLVRTFDDARQMAAWVGERHDGPLCVDWETTGLNPYKGKPRLVQLGDKQHGWVCPAGDGRSWSGFALELIENWRGDFAYHNAPFDIRWEQQHFGYQPPWERIHNTMTMAHLVDPTRPRGLKQLGDRLVDPHCSAGEAILNEGMRKQGWTFETVPVDFDPYWIYAGFDPVITAHVYDKLAPEVFGSFAYPYDIERAADRICISMMNHGALVDVPWVNRAITAYGQLSRDIRDWLKTYHGITSPLSSGQVQKALERLGVPILFYTKTGQASVTKEALETYVAMFPGAPADLCTALRNVRKMEKSIGTYLENFLEMRDGNDRIHPSLWVCEAKTSRMTCSAPNMQNLTRDDRAVRGSFIAQEGYVLMGIDANQIEARLAAHFSEDPGLIAAFRQADETGEDFFMLLAREIYRDASILKSDPRRQRTKNVMYAKQFGAGTEKMAITAGVPVEQIAPVHASLNEKYPGLNMLMDRTVAEGKQHPHNGRPAVYLPTGRRLLAQPGKEYTLANYRIQGHAAEVLKMGAAKMEQMGLGPYMEMPVHDEFILEVPVNDAEEVKKLAEQALDNRTDYLVPITWSAEIMPERWVKT